MIFAGTATRPVRERSAAATDRLAYCSRTLWPVVSAALLMTRADTKPAMRTAMAAANVVTSAMRVASPVRRLGIGAVSDPTDRTDRARVTELRAKLRDMDVDSAGAGGSFVPPHLRQQ